MKATLILFTLILLMIDTGFAHANSLNSLLEFTKPTLLDNCDSEDVKEYKDYDYKNPPLTYSNKKFWFKEIQKANKKKDYCRKAQALFHLYNFLPWKEYHELEIHKKVITSLYQGEYFFELQWQIKNYRELYGTNEDVEIMKVKSYWNAIDKMNSRQKCISQSGYYTDPRTHNDYDFVTEAYLSANEFLNNHPESKYSKEVDAKLSSLKDARVLKLICTSKNALDQLQKRSESKNTAYHYFAQYKRLTEIIVNFKEQERVDEVIFILIDICQKIDEKIQRGIFKTGTYANHPDEFIFSENWQEKASKLREILEENYPKSPWTHQIQRVYRP